MGGNNMKVKKSGFLVGLVACMLLMCMPVKAYYNSHKETPPFVINSVKTNQKTVKEGEYFEYTIVISPKKQEMQKYLQGDENAVNDKEYRNCKVKGITVEWSNQKPKQEYWPNPFGYESKTISWDGTKKAKISGRFKVQKGTVPGDFSLFSVFLDCGFQYTDEAGVEREGEFSNRFLLDKCVSTKSVYKKIRKQSTFKAIIEKVDTEAPQIDLNTLKVSANRVTSNQKVKISVKVTDNCGLQSVVAQWKYRGSEKQKDKWKSVTLKYNAKTDRYERSLYLPGDYQKAVFDDIQAKDFRGNYIYISRKNKLVKTKCDIVRK